MLAQRYHFKTFDCWLAERGLATLAVRVERAAANAAAAAVLLEQHTAVERVDYPSLPSHPDAARAEQLLDAGGSMVAFHLAGGSAAAGEFLASVREQIPFCPSLGETGTTFSHPESTSHRGLSADERSALGIHGGTLRLSVGIEQSATICETLQKALDKLA